MGLIVGMGVGHWLSYRLPVNKFFWGGVDYTEAV